MTKYEITDESRSVYGKTVFRILADDGRNGGFVESEQNLSQDGTCFLHGDSVSMDAARVEGDAQVFGVVRENAAVRDHAEIYGEVYGNVVVKDHAKVYGRVGGNRIIGGSEVVYGDQ
jgi:hypothetical protein